MSFLTELDVVNQCLGGMGMAPKVSLQRPDRFTAAIIGKLTRWNRTVQGKSWWFNERLMTLTPDAGSTPAYRVDAQLPAGFIKAATVDADFDTPIQMLSDGTIYDVRAEAIRTAPIRLRVTWEVPFDSLPDEAQAYIADCTKLDFGINLDGSKKDTDGMFLTGSLTALKMEDTRQRKANVFNAPGVAAKLQSIRTSRVHVR